VSPHEAAMLDDAPDGYVPLASLDSIELAD
jgi:hypothetical protein